MTEKKEMTQQIEKKWVDFEELTLCNNFMFGEVVADEKAGKDILEVILGKEIEKIVVYEKEKSLDNFPGQRGARFDVYLKDQADTILYTISFSEAGNKYKSFSDKETY